MKAFNFFTILSKDDKELIHSSFLRFLLKDEIISEFVLKHLFSEFKSTLNRNSISLEKVYSYSVPVENGKPKSKRIRLDIEAKSEDEHTILLIENKFKSFPNEYQLNTYDERFKVAYPNKIIVKYLLCFDKTIIPFGREDWHFISYKDVFEVMKLLLKNLELEPEKKIFIQHYVNFIEPYLNRYGEVKLNCGYLFFDGKKNENKFWIRHINAIVRLKLEKYFMEKDISVHFNVNPGNTSVPLINISPLHWNKNAIAPDLCIQVQDHNLKYYFGAKGNIEFNELRLLALNGIEDATGKFNKPDANRGETNFIYLERLEPSVKYSDFSVDDFYNRIIEFYEKVDKVARKRFA